MILYRALQIWLGFLFLPGNRGGSRGGWSQGDEYREEWVSIITTVTGGKVDYLYDSDDYEAETKYLVCFLGCLNW